MEGWEVWFAYDLEGRLMKRALLPPNLNDYIKTGTGPAGRREICSTFGFMFGARSVGRD